MKAQLFPPQIYHFRRHFYKRFAGELKHDPGCRKECSRQLSNPTHPQNFLFQRLLQRTSFLHRGHMLLSTHPAAKLRTTKRGQFPPHLSFTQHKRYRNDTGCSYHNTYFPQKKGGKCISLFFLPAAIAARSSNTPSCCCCCFCFCCCWGGGGIFLFAP